ETDFAVGELRVGEPVAEREERFGRVRVEEAMPDEAAFAVRDLAGTRRPAERRGVLDPGRKGRREPPTGPDVAEEDGCERGGHLLAAEPDVEDRRNPVPPRHRDGCARIDDDDRPRIRGGDPGDELVLTAGQRER